MRKIISLIVAATFTSIAWGNQQPIPPPTPAKNTDIIEVQRVKVSVPWTEFHVVVGQTLLMDSQVPAAKWLLLDDDDADLLMVDAGQRAAFVSSKAGVYRIVVVQNGEMKRVKITVADPKPVDPPKPMPPKPVDPPAPKPQVTDPLATKLKDALAADSKTTDKANAVKDLAALYRQAAKLAKKPTIVTGSDLMKQIHLAADSLLADYGTDPLRPLRTVVNSELNSIVPVSTGTLSDEQRNAASALFVKVSVILEGF